MPGVYEIRWLPNGPTEKFYRSRGNYYEFSESDRLKLHTVPVWCDRCGNFTEGENLSTVEEIDNQIRDLNDPTSEAYRMTRHGSLEKDFGKGESFLQDRLAELARRRTWREARKSPPKCIYCGSSEIHMFPDGAPGPHPDGGLIQIVCVGMCSTCFNEWFFTPEGDRIPRDTQPTYWQIRR
jgi:hypothetical protein